MSDDYIQEQALRRIDPELVDRFGDPNKHPEYQLTPEQIDQVLAAGREMFIAHLAPKDGFPIVTVHVYCLIDGEMWSTTTRPRVKYSALKKDPRCSICISTSGLGIPIGGAISIKAEAEIVEDRGQVERVCRELGKRYYATSSTAEELFFNAQFTPNRVAIRFKFLKVISWANIGMRKE